MELKELLPIIRNKVSGKILNSANRRYCPMCQEFTKTIMVDANNEILHLCHKCNYNHKYDWTKKPPIEFGTWGKFLKKKCEKPLVSVVILTFEGIGVTQNCLLSLIMCNRDEIDYEIIMVDNGSTDPEVKEFLNKLERIPDTNIKVVYNDTNRGVAGGRNDGVAVAKGKYIFFVDNDVIFLKEGAIANLVHTIQDGYVIVGYNKGNFDWTEMPKADGGIPYVLGATMLVEKKEFDRVCGMSEDWGICHCDDVD